MIFLLKNQYFLYISINQKILSQIRKLGLLYQQNLKFCEGLQRQMGKKESLKSKMNIVPEGIPAPYGIRKTFNHVVDFKKKRTNSLVKMKPLKDRENFYEVPEFCPPGYTKEQFDQYREEFGRIKELTKDDLKEILKINKQDTSPQMKNQLLNRCADGYALGRTPMCPHCFGTNPIYDKYKSIYLCPGYKEGETFIKCDSTFSKEQLPRIKPWNNNFEQRQAIRLQRTQRKLKHEREYQIEYKRNKKKRILKQQRRQRGQPTSSSDSQAEDNQRTEKQQQKDQFGTKKQADHIQNSEDLKIETQRE